MISAVFKFDKIGGNSVIELQTRMLDVSPQRTESTQRIKLDNKRVEMIFLLLWVL